MSAFVAKAGRIGVLTAEIATGEGELLGVFSRAATFRFGDHAVTVSAGEADSPLGIDVDALPLESLRGHVGARVSGQGGVIRIDGALWAVDIGDAVCWPGQTVRPHETGGSTAETVLDAARKTIGAFLRDEKREAGFSRLLGCFGREWEFSAAPDAGILSAAAEPVRAFGKAFRACDEKLCRAAAERLLGLGPGLTPSGDDFLVGLLAAVNGAALGEPYRSFKESLLPELLSISPGRTNHYGWSLFWSALRGCSSSIVIDSVERLLRGMDARPALARLARIGGSSGVDTLAGIMCGFSLPLPPHDYPG